MKKSLKILIFLALGSALIFFGGAGKKKIPTSEIRTAMSEVADSNQIHADSLRVKSTMDLAAVSKEKPNGEQQKEKPKRRNRGLLAIGVLLIVIALILWIR
jgi:hypothetical protein